MRRAWVLATEVCFGFLYCGQYFVSSPNPPYKSVVNLFAGHYCHEASTNRTQHQCGNTTVYCPRGSYEPTLIKPGFYGLFTGADAGETRYWSANNATYSVEVPCEPGYYCNGGVKNACPPGTFGWRYGMTNAQCGGLVRSLFP